jgi:hypothetical protein
VLCIMPDMNRFGKSKFDADDSRQIHTNF